MIDLSSGLDRSLLQMTGGLRGSFEPSVSRPGIYQQIIFDFYNVP